MSVTVTLKFRDNDGNVKSDKREITALTGNSFINMMSAINGIMGAMSKNESLKGLFKEIFGDEDVKEVDLAKLNSRILLNAVNSFESLFVSLPEHAFILLSAISQINVDELKSQEFLDLLDIYDAVIEVNDTEKIISRVKKSLALTRAKTKFLNLARTAAEKMTGQ